MAWNRPYTPPGRRSTSSTTGRTRGNAGSSRGDSTRGSQQTDQRYATDEWRAQPAGTRTDLDSYTDEFVNLYRTFGPEWSWGASTTTPSGGSSGGGGGYGGGGGGGGPALTQAMIDAYARVLGAGLPQLQLAQANLPAFRPTPMTPFNAAPYTTALGQVDQAVAADTANIAANQQATAQAVQSNYTNAYANAKVNPGAAPTAQGSGLMPGGAPTAAADAASAANADSQAAFTNLLGVLAAADQTAQNSRMNQVAMDANYGRQQLAAQALGLRGGINQQQAQAQTAWQQAAAERDYQNSLLAQQWAREGALNTQQTTNAQNQANWQQNSQLQTSRIQPILDLILRSAGTSGLNFQALFQAMGIQ